MSIVEANIGEQDAGLAPEERLDIVALTHGYESKRAVSIEALKLVQKRHRWVSDCHLNEVAALLDMSAAELDAVATFYNLIFRRPVGRHVIFLCDSVSCWIMGRDALLAHIQERLGVTNGQTTSDGLFTLLPIVCLGHCDHAPAMMLDGELHGDLDADRIDALLDNQGVRKA
jgi:NADH-quinone oxidoreductase subunit E